MPRQNQNAGRLQSRAIVRSNGELSGFPAYGQPHPERAEASRLNFSDLFEVIYRGKWIILLTCIIVTAAVTAVTMTIPPTYEAQSVVYVNTKSNIPRGVLAYADEGRALSNEVGILQESQEIPQLVAEGILKTADAVGSNDHFPILWGDEGEQASQRIIASRVARQTRFDTYQNQDIITIVAASTTPEEAALIANNYAEAYERYARETSRASLAATRSLLEQQAEKWQSELTNIEDQWASFAENREVLSLGPDGERLVQELVELRSLYDEARFSLDQEQTAIKLLQQELDRIEPGLSDRLSTSQAASGLQSRIQALDQSIAQLEVEAEQYYAVNPPDLRGNESRIPALAELVKRINHLKQQRDELTKQYVSQMSNIAESGAELGQVQYVAQLKSRILEKNIRIQELQERIRALNNRLSSYGSRMDRIPRQSIESKQLERRRQIAEQYYTMVAQELQRATISEEAELGYVKIIRSAFVPAAPVRPNLRQNFILGVLLGIGFGLIVAFIKRSTDNLLRQPEDIESKGYPLVGVIPPMDKVIQSTFEGREVVEVEGRPISTKLLTVLDPWSPIAENYRLVRTNLEHVGAPKTVKTVLITSPESSDGKTVTSVNLAIAMAQSGRRTLLIDADLRNPSTNALLGLPAGPGLAELLDHQDIEPIACGVPHLFYYPAGRAKHPPAELLGSDRMGDLLEKLRTTFDTVIIDSPPVLAVTDAVLLARQCDATIVVVSADRTDQRALDITRKTLASVGVSITGTIFNRFDAGKSGMYRYGYGYGYGYGKYGYGTYGKASVS